jgi:hypothetical protein
MIFLQMIGKIEIPSNIITKSDMMEKYDSNYNNNNKNNTHSPVIAAVAISPFKFKFSRRNRLGPISALLLSLLIISSASFWSPFLTSITEGQKLDGGGSGGDGETSALPLSLSQLLPSALAKSYERSTDDNRLEMRDSQAYGEDQASNPLNETPIVKG